MTENNGSPRPVALLRQSEAAALLQISQRTLQRLIKIGEIPVIRIGRQVRVDPVDLTRFIDNARS